MTQLKAFAMVVVLAFTFDYVNYDGYFWRQTEVKIGAAASRVASMHWRGFL